MEHDYFDFEKDKNEGEEYQDFIVREMWSRGLAFYCNSSKQMQLGEGESQAGIEIKFDRILERTGNVFIEVQALSKDGRYWINGGAFKKDNAWLYIIGNKEKAYVFAKNQLKFMWDNHSSYEKNGYIIVKQTPTAKGFLVTQKCLEFSNCVIKTFYFD